MITKDLRKAQQPIAIAAQNAIEQYYQQHYVPQDTNDPRYVYESMLVHTLLHGAVKKDRTGVGTWGIHGYQARYDLAAGFPLITTKKVHLKSLIYELLWFLQGDTNIAYLKENGVRIWDEWADENGDLGPVYGAQWRAWQGDGVVKDQITDLITALKNNPSGRRHIVSAWNVAELPKMKLSPCHAFFQCHTSLMSLEERRKYYAELQNVELSVLDYEHKILSMSDDELDSLNAPAFKLDLQLYQRSCDIFLGVPFNIASYALLMMMIAQVVNMAPGTFIHDYGDLHIYSNHFEQVLTQLQREPRNYPKMKINPNVKDIFSFTYEDFTLEGYDPHAVIKAEVAV